MNYFAIFKNKISYCFNDDYSVVFIVLVEIMDLAFYFSFIVYRYVPLISFLCIHWLSNFVKLTGPYRYDLLFSNRRTLLQVRSNIGYDQN